MPALTSSSAPDTMTSQDNRIQVRFTTQNSKYAHLLPTTPIYIPTHLRRFGLSEIIHHLVSLEEGIKKPFDFLIDNQLLTTSVQKYLDLHSISLEHVLEMQVVESVLPPEEMSVMQQDDWISDIHANRDYILVGLYDKTARLWNTSGHCVATVQHDSAVKAVRMVVQEQDVTVYMGGHDGKVNACRVQSGSVQPQYEYQGHTGGIESIRINPSLSYMATASTDATLCLFDIQSENNRVTQDGNRKRKQQDIQTVLPRTTLQGHQQTVSCMVFDSMMEHTLYSGSHDHTVRQWDLEQESNVTTMNCENVLLDMDQSRVNGLLATGHTDKAVRLWDPRIQEGMVVKLKLVSHQNWSSRVAWSPVSAYHVASTSYDGTCKIWDIRSNATPLYSISCVQEAGQKVFALCWSESGTLFTGGEDGTLRVHQCDMSQ